MPAGPWFGRYRDRQRMPNPDGPPLRVVVAVVSKTAIAWFMGLPYLRAEMMSNRGEFKVRSPRASAYRCARDFGFPGPQPLNMFGSLIN